MSLDAVAVRWVVQVLGRLARDKLRRLRQEAREIGSLKQVTSSSLLLLRPQTLFTTTTANLLQ